MRKETHILLSLLLVSLFVLGYALSLPNSDRPLSTPTAQAATVSPASGYAWSSNIGWISFNCTDTGSCGASNYVVNYDSATNLLSGYAWASNLGWISFNSSDLSGCPAGACQAQISGTELHGWAKVLSDGEFIGLNCADLSICGTSNYKVTYDTTTGALGGYAFGSNAMGWISFNCTDTGTCATSNYNVTIPVAAPTTCQDITATNFGSPLPCVYPPTPTSTTSTVTGKEVIPR